MFDTSIAARLLGDTEVGLQALVRNELGVELSKGSQRDDWSKRPLTAKQEAYALADVAHLMALAARLTDRLADAGRTEWAREEFEALASLPPAQKRTGPDEFRRIKGSAKLSRRQQAVLRELYVWREARAAAADRPPFKIVGPEILLAMAEQSPTTIDEVARRAVVVSATDAERSRWSFAAIQRGLELPERRAAGSRARRAHDVRRRRRAGASTRCAPGATSRPSARGSIRRSSCRCASSSASRSPDRGRSPSSLRSKACASGESPSGDRHC